MAAPNIANVTSIYGKTVGSALGSTSTTDILICPSDKVLKVNSIIASNIDGVNTSAVTVHFYDNSVTTRYTLASEIAVPINSSLVIIGKDSPIYLEEGDQIEAGATAASDLELVISYEELDDA